MTIIELSNWKNRRRKSPVRSVKKDCFQKIVKNIRLEAPSLPLPQGGQYQARRKSGGPEPKKIETGWIGENWP
jgi:hypothetical protein